MPSIVMLNSPGGFVQLHEDDPFVVPVGWACQFTALGFDTLKNTQISLKVDGVQVVEVLHAGGDEVSMVELPPGLIVNEGAVCELVTPVAGPPNDGRAWGHMIQK